MFAFAACATPAEPCESAQAGGQFNASAPAVAIRKRSIRFISASWSTTSLALVLLLWNSCRRDSTDRLIEASDRYDVDVARVFDLRVIFRRHQEETSAGRSGRSHFLRGSLDRPD